MAIANEKELLLKVSTQAANFLKGEGVVIPEEKAASVIPSIATAFIQQLITEVSKMANENDGEASVDVQGLLTVAISNRESEEGEKDGNRMISFIPGPKAKLLAKDDDASEGEDE